MARATAFAKSSYDAIEAVSYTQIGREQMPCCGTLHQRLVAHAIKQKDNSARLTGGHLLAAAYRPGDPQAQIANFACQHGR